MRNGFFCGVVQKKASAGDIGLLMRALGAGYVVEGCVVSTSMSKALGSRERIIAGSIMYEIIGGESQDQGSV